MTVNTAKPVYMRLKRTLLIASFWLLLTSQVAISSFVTHHIKCFTFPLTVTMFFSNNRLGAGVSVIYLFSLQVR